MSQTIFMTIREVAKTGIIREYQLRRMVKSGLIPGITSGNRFYINYPLMLDTLKSLSWVRVEGGAADDPEKRQ